jgi:hypothetical protein
LSPRKTLHLAILDTPPSLAATATVTTNTIAIANATGIASEIVNIERETADTTTTIGSQHTGTHAIEILVIFAIHEMFGTFETCETLTIVRARGNTETHVIEMFVTLEIFVILEIEIPETCGIHAILETSEIHETFATREIAETHTRLDDRTIAGRSLALRIASTTVLTEGLHLLMYPKQLL